MRICDIVISSVKLLGVELSVELQATSFDHSNESLLLEVIAMVLPMSANVEPISWPYRTSAERNALRTQFQQALSELVARGRLGRCAGRASLFLLAKGADVWTTLWKLTDLALERNCGGRFYRRMSRGIDLDSELDEGDDGDFTGTSSAPWPHRNLQELLL